MSKAIGYITQTDNGNFEGTLAMGVNERISVIANEAKKPNSLEPDYRIFGERLNEVGAGWNRTGQASGKAYISLTFEHPNISDRKLYANLGRVKGSKDKKFAMIWNPRS